MRILFGLGSLLALLARANASAQDAAASASLAAEAEGKVAASDEEAAAARTEEGESKKLAGSRATSELLELRDAHKHARELFGEGHFSLIPLVLVRFGCDSHCKNDPQFSAAGALLAPLWGFGGGHGIDFWPELVTDQEAVAYMRFEQRARDLSKIVAATARADGGEYQRVRATHQYAVLLETFRDILDRAIVEGHGIEQDQAIKLLECLTEIESSNLPASVKLQRLDELWGEYEYLYGKSDYRRRHDVLFGPVLGTPLDELFGQQWLIGLGVEVGGKGYGVSIMFGCTLNWERELLPHGLWAGVGFSGEPTANLIHGVSGAADWAAKL